jgi:uncharacterized membrane protein YqjE
MTTTSDSAAINPLDAVRMLRSAGAALFTQAAMHGQLARLDWAEEKTRLVQVLLVGLIGFAGLLCVLLFAGALVLAFSWDTAYRIQAAIALVVAYGLIAGFAWSRLKVLSARGSQAFAATRAELAAALALLKSKL